MNTSAIFWMCFTLLNLTESINLQRYTFPDIEVPEIAYFSTEKLIRKFGYPVETHTVITDDGYILALQRIPYSPKLGSAIGKPAVLYIHGFSSNNAETLVAGPGNSLSLFLSDSGYDIWLGNLRGNRYTRKHVSLNPRSFKFWDYTWSEIGYYDVSAMIDYILSTTRQEKIFYIGLSRGATVSYALFSDRPEYNDKIKAIISMAPIAYLGHIYRPVYNLIVIGLKLLQKLTSTLGIYRLGFDPTHFPRTGQVFCKNSSLTFFLCQTVGFAIFGFDYKYFDSSLLAAGFGQLVDAVSTKEFIHTAQLVVSGKFRHYDYGYEKNLKVYNSTTPTDYNLTKITAPVHLFYSDTDPLSAVGDVDQLYRELGNPVEKILVSGFNHATYVLGKKNVREILHEKILDILQRY